MQSSKYFGHNDILKRWIYTRNGLYKLMKSADFPAPIFSLNGGRDKVWLAMDIIDFEISHPEVLDEKLKRFKVASYAKCALLKRRGQTV